MRHQARPAVALSVVVVQRPAEQFNYSLRQRGDALDRRNVLHRADGRVSVGITVSRNCSVGSMMPGDLSIS